MRFNNTQCVVGPAERQYMDVLAGQLHMEVDRVG